MNSKEKIIVVAGGSFQGKSLIALDLAHHLNFSGVLTTDTIRNIFKTISPDKPHLSTSTYLLSTENLNQQYTDVSKIILDLIPIYQSRGEHIVIEGMHFTPELLHFFSKIEYCNIFLNNKLPFHERIIKKQITRSNLSMQDGVQTENIDEATVESTRYYVHQERIKQIHYDLMQNCVRLGFHIVEFDDLNDGKEQVIRIALDWIKKFKEG